MFVFLLMVMSRSLLASTMDSEDCGPLTEGSEVTFLNNNEDKFYLWYKVSVEVTQITMTVDLHIMGSKLEGVKLNPFSSSNTEHFIRISLPSKTDGMMLSSKFTNYMFSQAVVTKLTIVSNTSVDWIKCSNDNYFPSLSRHYASRNILSCDSCISLLMHSGVLLGSCF
ncbi:uncharacterized protein LOC121853640 [Homarus americanus]|uniref:uncharacterized protein LOC121853640 n=1 Tax=Homarus americanus TaxID=6706 RepID=UPI001C43D753|nr:uncharacterized protein LOC121853640 [Homarus americanus]